MIPLHELLNRIQWDAEFGRGEFTVGYYDRVRRKLVYVPLREVRRKTASDFWLEMTDELGVVRNVPYHRVKEVWKDGVLIWQRKE